MENILTAHPDIQAVLSENDNMATGVTAALNGNTDGKVKIGAQDGDTFALNRVALGTQGVEGTAQVAHRRRGRCLVAVKRAATCWSRSSSTSPAS